MRRIFKWILNILTIVFALLLGGAYLSRVIDPGDFWPLSFLGLIFPILIIFSIVLLIILILTKNKFALVLIVLLIMGWNPIKESFQLFPKSQETENKTGVRVMSYNAKVFDYFRWREEENKGLNLLNFVVQQKPDIICFQEFIANKRGPFNIKRVEERLDFIPYKYSVYFYKGRTYSVGLAIYSKYPIINSGGARFPNDETRHIFADVKINNDTVRIITNHLESNRLSKSQKNAIDSLITTNPKNNKTEYLGIIQNMKSAYIERSKQAKRIQEEINSSPHPVIVTGDFNDTPVSYSYRTISNNLQDAFVSSGRGLGATYREFMLPLRIDYLLHDPKIISSDFLTHEVDFSDHCPVEATFWFDNSER